MFKILNKTERIKKKYEKNYSNILESCELFEEISKDIFFTKLKMTNAILIESSSNLSSIFFDKEKIDFDDLKVIPRNSIINNSNKIKIKSVLNKNGFGNNGEKQSIYISEEEKYKYLECKFLKKDCKINNIFNYKVKSYLFYKKQFETFSNNSMPINYINIAYKKMLRSEKLVLLQLSELKEEYMKKFIFLELKTEINLDLVNEYSALSDLIFNHSKDLYYDKPYKIWTINKPVSLANHFDNLGFVCISDFQL